VADSSSQACSLRILMAAGGHEEERCRAFAPTSQSSGKILTASDGRQVKMSFWKPALAPAAPRGAAGQGILFSASTVLDFKKDPSGMTCELL